MASKRLIIDEEEAIQKFEICENQENVAPAPQLAKRYKATPLQRMLQRDTSSTLSPITELSRNMRVTKLAEVGTPRSTTQLRSFNSLSSSSYDSCNSLDDEYIAMFELENQEEQLPVPGDLDKLIRGQLREEEKENHHQVAAPGKRRPARRCLSMLNENQEEQQQQHELVEPEHRRPQLRKTLSMNDADILTALGDEPELIGDLSKPCALPVLLSGVRHRDLKTISCETLARLIQGQFEMKLAYQIIDCRYPYEYLGGHILGALNLYTKSQIKEAFPPSVLNSSNPPEERKIYIFHCEFSSERGPKLLRFLRGNDRNVHTHTYPALDYPELYLLHNGYKEFFSLYKQLCEPGNYIPMLAPAHNEEFRYFRAKTKSWQSGDSVDEGDSGFSGSRSLRKSRSRLLYAE